MRDDPILEVLNDLLNYDEILACMVARHNMISVMPEQECFDPKVMELWDIIKHAMDDVFGVIREYSQAGLGEMEFRLQDYEVLFYIFPDTENALVAIIPALANKGLIEVEMENTRREILKIMENKLQKLIKFTLDGITSFSQKPLKMEVNLGFLSILIAVGLMIYVFISKLLFSSITVPGWASILITVIFFGGVQLFTIGIICAYIGRIYDEVKNRPLYIIDEEINADD